MAMHDKHAEKWLDEPKHQVGQPKHQRDCGDGVVDYRCERCRLIVIMRAYAKDVEALSAQEGE